MITPMDFVGLVLGIGFYELAARTIATRKPFDTSEKAMRPWYGRDAAAAAHRRPSMSRLVLPMAAAAAVAFTSYQFPLYFMLGVLLSVVRELLVWYIFPLVFRVRHPGDTSWSNRLFPLEQWSTQDQVEDWFLHWDKNPGLRASQCAAGEYLAHSPIHPREAAQSPGVSVICEYSVQAGDDLDALLADSGVTLEDLILLNHGEFDWKPGALVRLPSVICLRLLARDQEQQ